MSKKKSASTSQDVQELLGDGLTRRWWQSPTLWIGVVALAGAAGAYLYWQQQQKANAKPVYVTEAVKRGDLSLTVLANGTLQPTRTVNVGSELSGTVRNVLVDVNDAVKKGQVLVELDTDKLQAQLNRSKASVMSAQARLQQSQATLKESRSNFARLQEVHRISGGKVPSAAEMDAGQATVERSIADEAAARASVDDARAALKTDETNLSKASIKSPIDGVILTRTVDPGNAVAASLQAVTLFTVAEDLKKLRLEVSVDEADIGQVQAGQRASFTVSAHPSRTYPAKVTRVDYGSTKTDNVVTYLARLEVHNEDLSLRPGMTASSTIRSSERKDVILVPNAALRFTPVGMQAPAVPGAPAGAAGERGPRAQGQGGPGAAPGASGGGIMGQLMPQRMRSSRGVGGSQALGVGQTRYVWVLEGGAPVAVQVKTGISDGRITEVESDKLAEGAQVITDQRNGAAR
ncbi:MULTISPECIES: efflux RND transporter periplasmic adaptor subunit [Comamonas]|uniref:Efflux RND transporter periplasmic adaptor subunit n=1 Tax=Comamonas avium TaxID=2762231 RepID=A0ABR8SAH7_9BURK|nr:MULTISPECIES: efflux RND transporter periplasmic adaptor subunit [Comamonas]MBD7960463.1 efflux RND transporter periplasmic adaptor subunit [Comamonas avium]